MSTNEFQEIPKVELVNFSFSPPGPMGWSAAEYETMLEDPETFLSQDKYRKEEPPTGDVELIELPIKTRKPQEAYVPVPETVLPPVSVQEHTLEATAFPPAAVEEATHEAAGSPNTAVAEETHEAEVPIASIVKETLEAETILNEEPSEIKQDVLMQQQGEAANFITMSEHVSQDQMEAVQKTINTSMSLIEMFSALSKQEQFSDELESVQESMFRSKRKSKHRNSTRKNRVFFM